MATITLSDRQSWLAARKTGLGASDVPTVLGLTPTKSPFALWAEKCDLLPEQDLAKAIEAVDWGLRLQEPICQGFADRTGRLVEQGNPFEIIRSEEHPFLFASLDAMQTHDGRRAPLEAKNVGAYLTDDWKDGQTPLKFEVQVQCQLHCTRMAWGSIAALVGGNKLVWRDLDRDDAFIRAAIPHLKEFWWRVENRIPPPVDASVVTTAVLSRLHPDDDGSTVELPDEALEWHNELANVKEKIKVLEELKALNENRLRAAIGGATFGQLPNGEVYSYKTQTMKEHVRKESTFRVLRKLSAKG